MPELPGTALQPGAPPPILGAMPTHRTRPLFPEEPPQPPPRRCDHPGCTLGGEYRAPKSRDRLHDYFWFCLDHVREYNKAWNYYAGLSDAEVEQMVRYDTVWQRPTWPMGSWHVHEQRMRERIYRDFGMGGSMDGSERRHAEQANGRPRREHWTEEDQALAVLDLAAPVDFPTVKARYKALVKRHHPDANGGSREAEERLKTINHAYGILKASFAS